MQLKPSFKIAALAFIVICINACSSNVIPDLSRLYKTAELPSRSQETRSNYSQPPVILIHGAFGSRLNDRETNEELWPGNLWRILFSDYEGIALPIDAESLMPTTSNLVATDVTDKVVGKDYYGAIIRTLEQVGGYARGIPGEKKDADDRQYYLFVYDWREDNVQTVRKLDALIEQIRKDYYAPDLKVDIVAHSMGGLITRYYLRYGPEDVLDDNNFLVNGHGFQRVNKVILLGTPNLGSVSALLEVLQGLKVGLNRIPSHVMLTWPSTYQLFPHPIRASMITLDGKTLDRDFFDIEIWRRFEWSIFNPQTRQSIIDEKGEDYYNTLVNYFNKQIERGRRFVWSLSVPTPESPVRHIVFGGDCELTPARLLVEEVDGESMVRLFPDEIEKPLPGVDYNVLMLEPGDGRVTKPSLFARDALDPTIPRHRYSHFPLDYAMMLCESHDTLTGNIHFQDNLLNVLLTNDQP
jgi:pimeloyl-ACP methyl ester carboxylesterase